MLRKTTLSAAATLTMLATALPGAADAETIESASYPLRVHYSESGGESVAAQVLALAESNWQLQVEQMGFTPPTTENELGERSVGLNIHLDPNAIGDHAEPIGDNPDTPWTDCTTRVIIRTFSPVSYLELLVGHELNHALEMAADCGESGFAWENTTVAVDVLRVPDDPVFGQYFLPTFQQNPHHGIDCLLYQSQETQYFHYGAALFQVFLENAYGDYDGKLLAAIWDAAKQDGTIESVGGYGASMDVPNDPHLLDAIRTVLGDTTLEEALATFARWRYFVGLRDDGAHFTEGARWTGAEVAMDTTLTLAELPLAQGMPNRAPNELGMVYLELDLAEVQPEQGAAFSFMGDPTVGWRVEALLVRSDRTADVQTMDVAEGGVGEFTLAELSDYERAVFVVTNVGTEDHHPDWPSCQATNSFSYDLAMVDLATPPSLHGVDPSELTAGATTYVWVSGEDFSDGLQVAVDGGGVEVGGVDFVDETSFGMELTVTEDAEPGPRSLAVTNPNGAGATLDEAFTVADGAEEAAGCTCATPARSHAGAFGWGALLALGLPLFIRRRRRLPRARR